MFISIKIKGLLLIMYHLSDSVPLSNNTRQMSWTGSYDPAMEHDGQELPGMSQEATSVDLKDSDNDPLKPTIGNTLMLTNATPSTYVLEARGKIKSTVVADRHGNTTGTGHQKAPTSPTFANQMVPTNASVTTQSLQAIDYNHDALEGSDHATSGISDQEVDGTNGGSKGQPNNTQFMARFNDSTMIGDLGAVVPAENQSTRVTFVTSSTPQPVDVISDDQGSVTSRRYSDPVQTVSPSSGEDGLTKSYLEALATRGTGHMEESTVRQQPSGISRSYSDLAQAVSPSSGEDGLTKSYLEALATRGTGHTEESTPRQQPSATSSYPSDIPPTTEQADGPGTALPSSSQREADERDVEPPDSDRNPEVRPGLFEGDMVLDSEENSLWRVGLRSDVHKSRLWSNNTVPYVISPLYEPEDYVTIYKAITTLNFMTCVRFVPWDGRAKDYVLVWPVKYPKGCWSHVGRTGGVQLVSLEPPDHKSRNCLGGEGRVLHELLHTLGIFHEQSRADRDTYVRVHEENIRKGYKKNFKKQSLENTTYAFEYDYNSIMHYGKYFFSKKRGKPTLTALLGSNSRLGQRRALSKTDCLKVNHLYNCLASRRYYVLCNVLGI